MFGKHEKKRMAEAQTAAAEEKEYMPGNWCRHCREMAECGALAEDEMKMEKEFRFMKPELLSPEETADVLRRLEFLIPWAEAVRERAVKAALKGVEFPGWTLKEASSKRRYTDEEAVAKKVRELGFEPYEKKILSIPAMEKMMGTVTFEREIGMLVERPRGKMTLVHV